MAKGVYIGVDSKARKVKKIYIGVNGVARKVKKAYVGVGGVARLCWAADLKPVYHGSVGNSGGLWFDLSEVSTKLKVGQYAGLYADKYSDGSSTPSLSNRTVRFWNPSFVKTDVSVGNWKRDTGYTSSYVMQTDSQTDYLNIHTINSNLVSGATGFQSQDYSNSNKFAETYSSPNYLFFTGTTPSDSIAVNNNLTVSPVVSAPTKHSSRGGGYIPGYLLLCGGYDTDGDASRVVEVYNDSLVKGTSFYLTASFRNGDSNECASTQNCLFITYSHAYICAMAIDKNLTCSNVGPSAHYEYHFAMDAGDYIMLLGYGKSGSNGTRKWKLFNTTTMTYEEQEDLPFSVGTSVTLTSSDSIVVLGGSFIGSTVYSTASYGFKLN